MLHTSSHHELNQSKNRKTRYRYIGFRIILPERNLAWRELSREIERTARNLYPKDVRNMRLKLVRFNGREGMLRCSHLYKNETIQLLYSMDKLENESIKIETVGTSGTIRSLNRKFFGGRLRKQNRILLPK